MEISCLDKEWYTANETDLTHAKEFSSINPRY